MSRSLILRLVVVLVVTSVYGCVTGAKSSGLPVIALEKPVHFSSAEGESLVVPAGTYRVGYGGNSDLQLVSERTSEVMKIHAAPTVHDESTDSLLAFSVSNEPDEHHVILWLPGGMGLDAAGTYSGVQSRAVRTLNQQAVQRYAQTMRSSYLSDRMSGSPPPTSPLPDLVMTASLTPSSPRLNDTVSLRLYLINQGQADATLVAQQPVKQHISLQTFDSAGNAAGGTGFFIPTLPLTIPAGASRYVDLSAANQKWMTNRVGTFYWQFTLYSYITESNTANNVGPRMPMTIVSP
jgi:hypothetical protein